jgi:hypothetical protein
MKSLIQAVAVAFVLAAPVASFAQSASQPQDLQEHQAAQTQAAGLRHAAQTDDSGYGVSSHGTWQSGRGTHTTVSSYSPPIYNAR